MPTLRIITMCISLAAVIYVMSFMRSSNIEDTSFGNVIGLKSGKSVVWNWCSSNESPAVTIKWKNFGEIKKSYTLSSRSGSWQISTDQVNLESMESLPKWLIQNCKIQIEPNKQSKTTRVDHQLEIVYKSNEVIQLSFTKANNSLSWGKRAYTAPGFYDSLLELEDKITDIAPKSK